MVFIPPLTLLYYVQAKNFILGKTTMERHGRVGNDTDRENRIRNSGIVEDMQIYRTQQTRVASLAGQPVSSSFSLIHEEHESEPLERLIHDAGGAEKDRNASITTGR